MQTKRLWRLKILKIKNNFWNLKGSKNVIFGMLHYKYLVAIYILYCSGTLQTHMRIQFGKHHVTIGIDDGKKTKSTSGL